MRLSKIVIAFGLALQAQVCAQAGSMDPVKTEMAKPSPATAKVPADPFDFARKPESRSSAAEEVYLALDESIKLKIEPLERSPVVDRVVEDSTIYVNAPGLIRVEIYMQAVDSPYCGSTVGKPKLLGTSNDAKRNFPVIWRDAESSEYVKVFARVYKRGQSTFSRSRSIDLAMGGPRFREASAPPK